MEPLAPTTVATLLRGADREPAVEELRRELSRRDVAGHALAAVGRIGGGARGVLEHKIAQELDGVLDQLDIGALVLGGWVRYRELVAAARRTTAPPYQPEDVVLAQHEITSTHHPAVEVIVNGRSVRTIVFDLEISLALHGVVAEVSAGTLRAIRSGGGLLTARLALEQGTLWRREAPFAVGAVVRIRAGIPLIPEAAAPGPGPGPTHVIGRATGANRWP